jgi:hypothetical protein
LSRKLDFFSAIKALSEKMVRKAFVYNIKLVTLKTISLLIGTVAEKKASKASVT